MRSGYDGVSGSWIALLGQACVCVGLGLHLLGLIASGALSGHLRLEPPDQLHAFFTGDSFFVTCIADETSGATRLTWQGPSGRDITHTTGRVHVESAPHSLLGLELVVEDVKHRDAGTFTCSAVVDGRETRAQFVLKVYLSITFWGTPETQVGQEGTDHMITCSVRSDPSPIVSWYVNGSIILDGPRRTVTEDGLFVRNLKASDAGNYTCRAFVVTPHSSQIKDKHIEVAVHYKPVWHNPDLDTFFGVVGSAANVTCEAHARPPPTFEWFKGRALLGNSRLYRILNGKWESVLQIRIKDASAFGPYLCLVSNAVGEIQRPLSLLEGVLPNPPGFQLSSEAAGVLVLKLSQSPLDPLPVTSYKVRWKLASETWQQGREYLASRGSEFVIQDLQFDADYTVRVAAKNAIGFGNFSQVQLQRTRGLLAETVMDGTSVFSSTYSGARHHATIPYQTVFRVICACALVASWSHAAALGVCS